ncbi:MAG: FtsH protease activity modulator HflK [Myxococcota bacterium]
MARNVINFDPRRPSMGAVGILFVAVVALLGLGLLSTGLFTIGPEEEGVILRFGREVRVAQPGLHFKLPYPVEAVYKVPTKRQLKEEFGFRTVRAERRTQYDNTRGFEDEKLMLTGDLNVASVEWIAQYRVNDASKFLFKVRNVQSTFRDLNEAVMREIIGDRSVTEVLTIGRQEIEFKAQEMLQEKVDEYEMGITIDQVVLQNVNPPDAVKASFDEVNQAQQERERLINEAKTAFNQIIPAAKGRAEETLAKANGYATERVNFAEGEAAAFTKVREAYERAPEVTRQRIYLETMAQIYPKAKQKIVMSDSAKGVLPLLQLDGGK